MRQILRIILLTFGMLTLNQHVQAQQTTGVYVNGEQLNIQDLYILQSLVGPVYPGKYALDEQGNFGVEGYPPVCNLNYIIAYMVEMSRQQYQYQQQATTNQYLQQGNSYQRANNGQGGFHWREGGQSGYINNRTGVSVTPAGENSVISIGGRVLNLP